MAVLNFLDIAAAHLTDLDVELLDAGDLPTDSMKYETGWIVSTAPLMDVSVREGYVERFREHGMSEAFVGAARKAAEMAKRPGSPGEAYTLRTVTDESSRGLVNSPPYPFRSHETDPSCAKGTFDCFFPHEGSRARALLGKLWPSATRASDVRRKPAAEL